MPTRIDAETIAGLTGTIYEAAFDHERWQDVVERLRLILGGSRTCIIRTHPEGLDAVSTIADRELESRQAVEAYYRDPISHAVLSHPVGVTYRKSGIAGSNFQRGELFNDWYRPRDMIDGIAANLVIAGDALWILCVHRGTGQSSFDESEIAVLRALLPHVLRSGELGIETRAGAIVGASPGHVSHPLFIVDGEGFLVRASPSGEAMLCATSMPVRARNGRLSLTDPGSDPELRSLVAGACSLRGGARRGSGGAMLLNDTGGTEGETPRRFIVTVAPFTGYDIFGIAPRPLAVVLAREVTLHVPDGFAERIAEFFALSPSEAAIAAAIASGYSLQQAAADRKVTVKTARTYLERVFRKTGTTRQHQLVALLKNTQPGIGKAR